MCLARVFLAEFIDPTTRVDDLLLARVERMAVRADFDLQVVAQRRTRDERVPAGAGHSRVFVLGMDSGFHDSKSALALPRKKGAQCSHAGSTEQAKVR
jgi:hypothetical protein